jgi:hypothetical protein
MNLDNQLPSPSEQLNLLKQQLNKELETDKSSDIFYKYCDHKKPDIINFIYERPESGKILKVVTLKLLDYPIEKIMANLAESLIRMWNDNNNSDSKVMNVLAPSAMEDFTYLGYTFFTDKMCLSGEASIWIKKEESDIVTLPIPDLVLSR